MSSASSVTERVALPPQLEAIARRARPLATFGAVLWAIGALLNSDQAFRSYLFAFLFWIGVAIGCQSILMLHHLSGGRWGLGIRRMLEAGSRTLVWAWLGFLPLAGALLLGKVFPWTHPDPADALLAKKLLYLNVPFFLARAAFYFASWALLAHLLSKWSLERDRSSDPSYSDKLQGLSGGGLVLMGLTITFASVDWAMSLNPHWFSTIYGVLFMVGQVLSALAFMILLVALAGHEKPLDAVITRETVHDLGKLLFAFVMLWAYMQLSQFLIIWSANLPEEVPWYIQRLSGGWQFVALLLVAFHFVLPFVLLLSRNLKRNAATLAKVAAGIFLVRLLDLYWLIAPDFQGHGAGAPHGLHVHWLDLVTPLFLGGLWLLLFTEELRSRPLLTPGDPELQELLAQGHA
jgi:hypothetical protein